MYWHQLSLLALATVAQAHIWDWPPYSDDSYSSSTTKKRHHSSKHSSKSSISSDTSSTTPASTTADPTGFTSSSTTEMPTTTRITILSTLTTLLTSSSAAPQEDKYGPIKGLPQCAQDAVIPTLANACSAEAIVTTSCVCNNLPALRGQVAISCPSPEDLREYDVFIAGFCPSQRVPIVTANTAPPFPTGTAAPVGNTTVGPFNNGTAAPVSFTTSTILIPTTGPNGEPTTVTSEAVLPLGGTPTGAPPFVGTGAAVAVKVPEFGFGSVRAAAMGGAIGLMGLVFAEL